MRHLQLCRQLRHTLCRHYSSGDGVPHVAIVGSGPGGFYTAQQLLKGHTNIKVDIYERLPVPFGLVRFGVAPDHPEVKNVINTFTQTASKDRCNFLGNVTVGKDVTVADLRQAYTAVVMAYGAEADRKLGIPGENLPGVLSARTFVGWYNGLPEDKELRPNLDTDTVAVLGHGNVALDVARILLTPIDILRKTDTPEYALDILSQSRVKRVVLIGRRGPLQVAFTIKELREMIKLPGSKPILDKSNYEGLQDLLKDFSRPRKRLTELMMNTALQEIPPEEAKRRQDAKTEWQLKFLRSPLQVLSSDNDSKVTGIRLGINKLEGEVIEKQKAVPTGEIEDLPCGLILTSIGYKSLPIEGIPYDENKGIIANGGGKVTAQSGLYCSGWVKRGPTGVILSTMTDAFETGKMILKDLTSGQLQVTQNHIGQEAILPPLQEKGKHVVTFDGWKKINKVEEERGAVLGKPQEKIVNIKEMLEIASQ